MKMRKESFPFGIPNVNLREVEREVPASEPPAWPINDQLKYVGKNVKRTDAILKVTGQAKYTSDIKLPGMLYGAMLGAAHPSAKILAVDTSAALRLPGVKAIYVLKNRIGGASTGEEDKDSGYPEIKYAGQPIAGVAADDYQTAEAALDLIKVKYDTQPFVIDFQTARKDSAPLVFAQQVEQEETGGGGGGAKGVPQRGNVRGPSKKSFLGGPRGDIKTGFAEADIVVEGEFKTQVQTHSALETHGVVADWKPNLLTVYASTQETKGVRRELADMFDLPESKIRVICEYMGGGFGAKYGAGHYGIIAVNLSKRANRPVKLMLDRKAEHLCVGNRPSTWENLKIGAKRDGTLTAIEQTSYGTAGVGLGAGVGRIAQALYKCPNFYMEQYDVFTNAGPGAAFRAPGNVQGAFSMEQLIDELAEKINVDPLALREKIDESEVRREERKVTAEAFGWSKRQPANSDSGVVKRGMGVAQSTWPRLIDVDSTAEICMYRDGTVEIRSGVMDIGTGTRTILAQVVAEELGITPEEVSVKIGDTLFPNGPASGGSKATGSITPAARNAAYKAKLELLEQAAKQMDEAAENLHVQDGMIVSKSSGKKISFKDALKKMRTAQILVNASRSDDYGGFMVGTFVAHSDLGSVQMAEVSVNTETGFVKVERIVAAHSCGRPLNPLQIQSQVNGGIIQGVSYALYEDRVMDETTGHMLNTNLDQYKIAFSMEIPEIEVINIEEYSGRSSTDAYGIAEPANIATAAAIANAVYNAIGVRIYELPITPARILKALGKYS